MRQGLEDGALKSMDQAVRHWGFRSPFHVSQRYLETFGEKTSQTERG